jgi:hypothetical protein
MSLTNPKNMKLTILLALVALCGLLSACGNSDDSNWGADTVEPPVVGPFPAPQVTPELDEAQASSAVIGPAGGTLHATGSDGTQFTLELPPGALAEEQTISLTPIQNILDMPFKTTFTAGAALGPDGLVLRVPGTLTVEKPDGFIRGSSLAFGYEGPGELFHLMTYDLDDARVSYTLFHFSGYGYFDTSPEEVDALDAMSQAQYPEPALQAQNQIAIIVSRAVDTDTFSDQTLDQVEQIFRKYFEESVQPPLVAAAPAEEESTIEEAISKGLIWYQMVDTETRRLGGRVVGEAVINKAEVKRLGELVKEAAFQAVALIDKRMVEYDDIQIANAVVQYDAVLTTFDINEDLFARLSLKVSLQIEAPDTIGETDVIDIVVRPRVAIGSNPPKTDVPVRVELSLRGAQPSSEENEIMSGGRLTVSVGMTPGSNRIEIEATGHLGAGTGVLSRIEAEPARKTVGGKVTVSLMQDGIISPFFTATLMQGRGPLAGVPVQFSIVEPNPEGGYIDPTRVVTDSMGRAGAQYHPERIKWEVEVEASATIGEQTVRVTRWISNI